MSCSCQCITATWASGRQIHDKDRTVDEIDRRLFYLSMLFRTYVRKEAMVKDQCMTQAELIIEMGFLTEALDAIFSEKHLPVVYETSPIDPYAAPVPGVSLPPRLLSHQCSAARSPHSRRMRCAPSWHFRMRQTAALHWTGSRTGRRINEQ
jgi:hypothetical protein